MNFGEAVNSALIKKYATFKGRACRAEWWYFLLFSFLVIVFAASVAVFFNIDSVDWKYLEKLNSDQATEYFINSDLGKTLSAVSVVLTLALFIPGFAVTVRRVQDLDANYYWSLPYLVAALIGLWEAFFPPVTDSAIRLAALSNLITIVYCLAFLRRGSFDENRFGPDPLEAGEDTY